MVKRVVPMFWGGRGVCFFGDVLGSRGVGGYAFLENGGTLPPYDFWNRPHVLGGYGVC